MIGTFGTEFVTAISIDSGTAVSIDSCIDVGTASIALTCGEPGCQAPRGQSQ